MPYVACAKCRRVATLIVFSRYFIFHINITNKLLVLFEVNELSNFMNDTRITYITFMNQKHNYYYIFRTCLLSSRKFK